MTVCIAAVCRTDAGPRVVLCTDQKAGSALGSAETALKQRTLGRNWISLTAGSESGIEALISVYRAQLNKMGQPNRQNIDEVIRAPISQRKRQLAEEYVQAKLAVSYEYFLDQGREKLPPDMFNDIIRSIASLNLDADFVIAGFISGFPDIYSVNSKGMVCATDEFAVAGEGGYLASAALLRRGQNNILTLEQTLYNVYEAKKYAEAVGSVGKSTVLSVLAPERSDMMTISVYTELAEMFSKYGPQSLPNDIKLTAPYFLGAGA